MNLVCGSTQDILATFEVSDDVNQSKSSRQPWNRNFKCDKVSFDVVLDSSIRTPASCTGSRGSGLPSLHEEYADFAQIGSASFCIASIETNNGIEFLFGRLFKALRQLSIAPSTNVMEEFMQALGMLEFVGMNCELDDATSGKYHTMYMQFLTKIGRLYDSTISVSANGCSQDLSFHTSLFAWHVACKLLNSKTPESIQHTRTLSGDDALVLMLDGLAALRRKCDSSIPCSCVQSVLVDLYCCHSAHILQLCFHVIRSSINNERLLSLDQNHKFGTAATTAAEFFQFFAEMISHFIDIRLIQPEEVMSKFVLLVGLGELLCDKEPLPTFKVLYSFMKKYQLNGLAKIRKSASKFISKILQLFECAERAELDKLSRGDPLRWAEHVRSSLMSCFVEELLLIQLLLLLLSDDELSSCRGILTNRYSSARLLSSDCVLSSVLSLLLTVLFAIDERQVLATKLCEWIAESVRHADEVQCDVLLNALDVLALVCPEMDTKNVNIPVVMANCLNALPLPEKSTIFTRRCSIMARKYIKEFVLIDINRFVSVAPDEDLLCLFRLLSDVDVEICGSIWDKATSLLVTSKTTDPYLRTFVVNQSLSRFRSCTERLTCAKPDENFLFTFCNGLLSRLEGQHMLFTSQLLPIWIYAVVAYSKSRELDTKAFTSMIWDHIVRILVKIDKNASLDISAGSCEAFVIQFFTVLGNNMSAGFVRKVVADAVPLQLANQIAALLKREDTDMQERTIRVCCEMLRRIGLLLLAIAEEEAPRTGLNRTAFVVLTQALVSKLARNSLSDDFLLQYVPLCVSALARLPYRMFLNSRLKDLLLKFVTKPDITCRILQELSCAECSVHYSQLRKDPDERLKNVFENAQV